MATTQDSQSEAVGTIDAAKALSDKVLTILPLLNSSTTLTFATNPIGFVLWLLEHLGVTHDELLNIITDILVYSLPTLEVSIKAIMLTNLKHMLACDADPRIPDKYRKRHKTPSDPNTSQEYGIDINLESIDFYNKLTTSPLSDEGRQWYFGLSGVSNVYEFARAEDFDAFLWFVMHKGTFPNSSNFENIITSTSATVFPEDATLLDMITLDYPSSGASRILPGNTFIYSGSSEVISLCTKAEYDGDNKIVKNTLVPVSDDWNSVNRYVNPYHLKIDGEGEISIVKKDREYPICNLQFLDQANASDTPLTGLVNNKFRFTILPKPYVHIPYSDNVNCAEPAFRFKKMLFNSKGEYDPNGNYTIPQDWEEHLYCNYSTDSWVEITPPLLSTPKINIDVKSGNVSVSDKKELVKHLIECYKGLTVYEFNYDYVMGMRLFDPKVVATVLLDTLLNIRLGLNVGLSKSHEEGTAAIEQIIKNIIESDDSTVDDCFFTFSNEKYDALLRNTEKKKAKRRDFKDVNDILNEYNNTATLARQADVLKRAITQASANITEGLPSSDATNIQFSFVTDLIEQLTLCLVKVLFSPKVLMLFKVNNTIMGGKWQAFSFEDLLKTFSGIIVALVKEIRDLILQELMKLLLKELSPIVAVMLSAIVREQLEAYTDVLNDIIRNCFKGRGNGGSDSSGVNDYIDNVDYADIDMSETKKGDSPQLNNC